MAFVKIVKGSKTQEVSQSAFENFFKNSGWEIAGKKPAIPQSENEKEIEKVEENNNTEEDDEWAEAMKEEDSEEEIEDEGIEKPLSEMTKKELIKFADEKGISLAGLSTVSQFRQAIEENLKED